MTWRPTQKGNLKSKNNTDCGTDSYDLPSPTIARDDLVDPNLLAGLELNQLVPTTQQMRDHAGAIFPAAGQGSANYVFETS